MPIVSVVFGTPVPTSHLLFALACIHYCNIQMLSLGAELQFFHSQPYKQQLLCVLCAKKSISD